MEVLCADCHERFAGPDRLLMPRCGTCALPLPWLAPPTPSPAALRCGACLSRPPDLTHCIAAVPYQYPFNELLQRLKFQRELALAPPLALLMASTPGARTLWQSTALRVAVPLAAPRLLARGCNQAERLLMALERIWPERGASTQARTQAQPRGAVLERLHDTESQLAKSPAERWRNLRGAFVVPPSALTAVRGQHVLLIDDVMTTGATLGSAAQALKAAGALRVSALVVARTA